MDKTMDAPRRLLTTRLAAPFSWIDEIVSFCLDWLICRIQLQGYNPGMKEIRITGNPTEEEVAACMAVIQLVYSADDTAVVTDDKNDVSPWGRAVLTEQTNSGTGGTGSKSSKQTLWGLVGRSPRKLLGVLLLAALSALALPCDAQNALDERSRFQQPCVWNAPPSNDNTDGLRQSHQPIRVALYPTTNAIALTLPDGADIIDGESNEPVAQLPSGSHWHLSFRTDNAGRRLCFTGKIANRAFQRVVVDRHLSPCKAAYHYDRPGFQPVLLDSEAPSFDIKLRPPAALAQQTYQPVSYHPAPELIPAPAPAVPQAKTYILRPSRTDGVIALGNKAYRGQLVLRPSTTKAELTVINTLDLEEYLLAVVPSEMPASWPLEALKAQAIAARSYAMANIGKHASEGWDVTATVEDQVYNGIGCETENSNDAVAQTRGLVIKHQGTTVSAFFHSAGGGCTELAEHVWGKPVPYLKSVHDYDDGSPHFEWTRTFSAPVAEECLKKSGKEVGSLLAILPVVKTPSGRLKSAMLIGSQSSLVLSGEELRKVFNLPSSLMNTCVDCENYVFAGRGHGHGLGMSQWGARSLADRGYNAAQILGYYYKDISVSPL